MKPLAERFQPASTFARSYHWPPYSPAALGVLIAGLATFALGSTGDVEAITVRKTGPLPEARTFVDVPDLYVVLQLKNGLQVRTSTRNNTPVGNGISWKVDKGLAFNSVEEVLLYDEDYLGDDILDRVHINQPKAKGQSYEFELSCSSSSAKLAGLAAILLSAPYVGFALVKFVRDQAI